MKKQLSLVLITVIAIIISFFSSTHQVYSQSPTTIAEKANFEQNFTKLGINGSIIIYDLQQDNFYQHNASRNKIAFSPESTYKIPNSLIALETGVIKDDITVLTWDGIARGLSDERPIKEWNQDLNMRLAFKYSAVWFYQVLARKVGHQRIQEFVTKIQYGNQNIGSEKDSDRFWLGGKLTITPEQQIEFLRRLYDYNLPFSHRNIELVKDIMIMEQTPDYTLRGKTGWGTSQQPELGWFVGYLEQNNNVYFFATNIDIVTEKDSAARLEVTRLCLQDLGLF
jgi:beta-lactamase class D